MPSCLPPDPELSAAKRHETRELAEQELERAAAASLVRDQYQLLRESDIQARTQRPVNNHVPWMADAERQVHC